MSDSLRQLPAVSTVLTAADALLERFGHARTVDAIRRRLTQLRERLTAGELLDGDVTPAAIVAHAESALTAGRDASFRVAINATGVILHTNLGRAPLAETAARAAFEAARHYVCLEMDPETGERSHRIDGIRGLLTQLTGAEAATAVNNCAAATVLTLRALAAGREVIVSRGELIEIGGSFRLPEIMASSGAVLREVGTTNITRVADYSRAVGPNTALILRVHQSNYRIRGFTAAPTLLELVELGRQRGVPVVDDIGSGAMLDLAPLGLTGEPVARQSIAAGADLVLSSGDKLLGGPQAGIIAGRADLVGRIEKDPLMRAMRLDKMTLAAMQATLELYADPAQTLIGIPILRMLAAPLDALHDRAQVMVSQLRATPGLSVSACTSESYSGGGSVPDQSLPSVAIGLRSSVFSEDELARRLRVGSPRIIGRVRDGQVFLDLRTVMPEQDNEMVAAVVRAVQQRAES